MKSLLYLSLFATTLLVGCNSEGEKAKESEKAAIESKEEKPARRKANLNLVETMVLEKSTFKKQINCNGKLRAIAISDLNMQTAGILTELKVSNGSYIKKGQLMAATDPEDMRINLVKAKRQVEKSYIDLVDELIGLGFDEDTTKVPKPIFDRAKVNSGYLTAKDQLLDAERKLAKCYLYAPFSGRVANLEANLHEQTSKLCTLINDSYFYVEFAILEAELALCKVGQKVVVHPFIDEHKQFNGTVAQINPFIDEKGQVMVRAKIQNRSGYLVEGMNVRVVMENEQPNLFVVPKEAVVIRDGYYVSFLYDNGTAVWTYVDVLYSNADSHAIIGSSEKRNFIEVGDTIITSGNLNLADGTEVAIRAEEKQEPQKKSLK